LSLLFLAAAIMFCLKVWEDHASGSWPRVPGTVVRSYTDHLCPGRNQRWAVRIVYRYVVDGQTHDAKRVGNSDPVYCDVEREKAARWLLDRYPAGKPVEVSYNPADPGAAYLEPGQVAYMDVGETLILLLFAFAAFRGASAVRSDKPRDTRS
jgi:hypothetical protein